MPNCKAKKETVLEWAERNIGSTIGSRTLEYVMPVISGQHHVRVSCVCACGRRDMVLAASLRKGENLKCRGCAAKALRKEGRTERPNKKKGAVEQVKSSPLYGDDSPFNPHYVVKIPVLERLKELNKLDHRTPEVVKELKAYLDTLLSELEEYHG